MGTPHLIGQDELQSEFLLLRVLFQKAIRRIYNKMIEPKIKDITGWKERLVGIEFENPVVDASGNPATFDAMQKVWPWLAELGWKTNTDKYFKIFSGAEKQYKEGTINLISDNGAGNFEIALPPLPDVHEAKKLLAEVHKDVLSALKKESLSLLAIGIQPGEVGMPIEDWRVKSWLYKGFEPAGKPSMRFGHSLFFGLSAHQTGVSIRLSEALTSINEFIKITGLVTALCGNSPIQNWEVLPWREWRIGAYGFRFIAPKAGFGKLTRSPEAPFRSLAHFYQYYWDTPLMILPPLRDGEFVFPDPPINYLEYFAKKEISGKDSDGNVVKIIPTPADINFAMLCMWDWGKPHLVLDPSKVSVDDFMNHIKDDSLEEYLDGKLVNCYLEYRGAPASPKGEEMALPSLVVGLGNNLDELKVFTKQFSWTSWCDLPYVSAVQGLSASIDGKSVAPLISELIKIAERGLLRRGMSEEVYLEPFKERIRSGKNPADKTVALLKEKGKNKFIQTLAYSS